jgi:hypothetical protein
MINSFDIEFFELVHTLKKELTDDNISFLRQKLLKLKNPTYYNKFVKTHPAVDFGYYSKKVINPVLIAITNMLNILKSDLSSIDKLTQLQKEYSWAYNNYSWFANLSK